MIHRLWKLMALKRELKKAKRDMTALRERLKREGVSDKDAAVPTVEAIHEIERIEAEIGLVRSSRFILTAIRLGIDVTPHANEWFYTRQAKQPYGSKSVSTLTKLGESKLRREIWIERRARWEFWLKVVGLIVTGLTGLLGTVIGIIAILKKSN